LPESLGDFFFSIAILALSGALAKIVAYSVLSTFVEFTAVGTDRGEGPIDIGLHLCVQG